MPQARNDRWSLDFVSGCLDHGRRVRILVIVDDASRECLAAIADTSISGSRPVREPRRCDRLAWATTADRERQSALADPLREAGAALPAKGSRDDLPGGAPLGQAERRGLVIHRSRQAAAKHIRRDARMRLPSAEYVKSS